MENFGMIGPGQQVVIVTILCVLVLWDAVWKAIAMWHSARRNQVAWFVCIAIFNTVGILPIVYLLINKGQKEA